MVKVAAVADLHGHLPRIPGCDLLVIAGDICPREDHTPQFQREWLDGPFRRWLSEQPCRQAVGIAGNHDFVFECGMHPRDLPWTYLQDSGTQMFGLRIWGTPWTRSYGDWAFTLDERALADRFSAIPHNTDLVISHGPPFGFADRTFDGANVGSYALNAALHRVQPKLAVFGHVHEGYSQRTENGVTLANVAVRDHRYRPLRPPTVFTI